MGSKVIVKIGETNAVFVNNLFYTTTTEKDSEVTVIDTENLCADFRNITEENEMDLFEFEEIKPEFDLEEIRIVEERITEAANTNQPELVIKAIEKSNEWAKSDKGLLKKLQEIKNLAMKAEAGKGVFTHRHIDEVRYVAEITNNLVVLEPTVYYLRPVGSDDSEVLPEK